MTHKRAQREAERRWGKAGSTTLRTNAIVAEERAVIRAKPREQRTREEQIQLVCSWRCTVGENVLGMFNRVHGQGDTWEEAFAKADAQAQREREQSAKARSRK